MQWKAHTSLQEKTKKAYCLCVLYNLERTSLMYEQPLVFCDDNSTKKKRLISIIKKSKNSEL